MREADRRAGAEARVLALAALTAGLVCWWTVLVPFSRTAPTHVTAVLGCVALGLAGALWSARRRVSALALHGVVAVGWLAVTASVALSTTPSGTVVTAFGYVWVAMHTAWFHPTRAATAHLAAMAAGLAVALRLADAASPLQTWVFVCACLGGVAVTLHRLVRRLRDLAERDHLTGLLNRAAFVSLAEHLLASGRERGPLTVALIDLDGFKTVNDSAGHAAGDRLLRDLAASWRGALGPSDVLARYGGDEFVLLVRGTATAAEATLARLAASTDASRWTAGLATWKGDTLERWLARADEDLYERKQHRSRA